MADKTGPQPMQQGFSSDIPQRMKMVEERLTNLRTRTELIDQNLLESKKKQAIDLKVAHSEISDAKKELEDFRVKMKTMIAEIRLAAKDEDLQLIKRYLEYFEPINFVMRKELKNTVRDEIQSIGTLQPAEADLSSVKEEIMREISEVAVKKEEVQQMIDEAVRKAVEGIQMAQKIQQPAKSTIEDVMTKNKNKK